MCALTLIHSSPGVALPHLRNSANADGRGMNSLVRISCAAAASKSASDQSRKQSQYASNSGPDSSRWYSSPIPVMTALNLLKSSACTANLRRHPSVNRIDVAARERAQRGDAGGAGKPQPGFDVFGVAE